MSTEGMSSLTVEERALLKNAMYALPKDLDNLRFWGKLLGREADYLIVVGQNKLEEEDDYPDQTFFFCTNKTFKLKELGVAAHHPEVGRKTALIGNPTEELVAAVEGSPEADEVEEVPGIEAYTEADLVALVVSEISFNTNIVPRGAFIADPCHRVVKNMSFQGLSHAEATDLNSYYHFRKPQDDIRVRNVDGLIKPTDFLDGITSTHPVGAWGIQSDHCNSKVVIRSLLYPGYSFTFNILTGAFCGEYHGDGYKNDDLAFMI